MRKNLILILTVGLLLLGCTSGDDEPSSSSSTDDTSAEEDVVTGPAPGVTADAIKIGVTFVDLEAIREVVNLDHGDYEAVYQALFDDINDAGGINGRMIEPVFAPVNPIGTEASEAACVKLTEDDDVFVAVGFFQDDAVLCYVEGHETAVVGGFMSPQRLERATVPWYTTDPGTDAEDDALRAFHEAGELDGKVGLYIGGVENEARVEEAEALLEELGVDVAETGVLDAPDDDVAAQNAGTAVIGERFRAAGVETVVLLGSSALPWANGMEKNAYQPRLVIPGTTDSVMSYVRDEADRDLSLLEDSLAAGRYGPAGALWAEEKMQACLEVLADHGIEIADPTGNPVGAPEPYVSAFNGCRNVTLLRALLEAAGENLNYGTLRNAGDDLGEVGVPGDPRPYTFGPPPAADGDPAPYLYDWDPAAEDFVIRED